MSEKKLERQIHVNVELPSIMLDHRGASTVSYPPNVVNSTKYGFLNFIPKNLFEQFRGFANIYFLGIFLIQFIPQIQTTSPLIACIPIMFILVATAIKDGIEDYRRHRVDTILNNSITWTLTDWKNTNYPHTHTPWYHYIFFCCLKRKRRNVPYCNCIRPQHDQEFGICLQCNQNIKSNIFNKFKQQKWKRNRQNMKISQKFSMRGWTQTHWKSVRVGDYVLLKGGDNIPADILILSTSEDGGICYAETKNLDGETNLKIKEAVKNTAYMNSAEDCHALKILIETETPYSDLFVQNGTVTFSDDSATFNIRHVLLRGSVLRNTGFVIGIAIYTGIETKVMLNSGDTPSKQSKIDKMLNPVIIVNFIILSIMCLANGIVEGYLTYIWKKEKAPFTLPDENFILAGLFTLGASIIMYQNIVPISLYITVEAMKTVQAYFINNDIDMYDSDNDSRCIPKTWNIADDLGQIDYIFSDKTGTLTENKMDFKKCSIGGIAYGKGYTDVSRFSSNDGLSPTQREDFETKLELETRRKAKAMYPNPFMSESKLSFIDPNIFSDFCSNTAQSEAILNFFTLLATCHTVLSPKKDPQSPAKIIYPAQSPDEEALVRAAKDMGITFYERQSDRIIINVFSQTRIFKILNVLEFNSTRKRMSIIIQMEDDKIMILTKGADNVIFERLASGKNALQQVTLSHLEEFANEGLRTLCLAQRIISPQEYATWSEKFVTANTSITNREEMVDHVSEEIERDLELIGVTAIEDKLQDKVPECIQTLRMAGIKIWVLTGDKKETAINIGFASNLFSKDMNLVCIEGDDPVSVHSQIKETLDNYNPDDGMLALVIEGSSLRFALDYSNAGRLDFLKLGILCRSIICCRVSPNQKAQVVKLVKMETSSMCLAIGDGANDVSMIQEAHIGVGIAGQEGLQAAMSSDYVIGKFKFLSRLLLVHGHWSYYRTGEMILNFFYKNLIWVFMLFWYQIYSGFTADLLFDFVLVMLYNLLFTSLPPVILGVFDQDLKAEYLLAYPQLYRSNINKKIFSLRKFFMFTFDSIYQSMVCFFAGYYLFETSLSPRGHVVDKEYIGTAIAIFGVVTANYYIGFSVKNWTWMVFVVIYLSAYSIVIYVPAFNLINNDPTSAIHRMDRKLYENFAFWLAVLNIILMCMLPRMIFTYIQTTYFPTDIDIIREEQKYNRIPLITQQFEMNRPSIFATDGTKKRVSSKKWDSESTYKDKNDRMRSIPSILGTGLLDMRTNTRTSHHGYAFSGEEDERENAERILGIHSDIISVAEIDDSSIDTPSDVSEVIGTNNRKKSGKIRKQSSSSDIKASN